MAKLGNIGKTCAMKVSGNMPAILLTFRKTAVRKNSSRKVFAKVESNQSFVSFSFFRGVFTTSG